MPDKLYIPKKVIENIAEHIAFAVDKAKQGYWSANEEEDTMTGALGERLRIETQKVTIDPNQQEELYGTWTWSIDYKKFKSKGKGATEHLLGADGVFELNFSIGNRKKTKSLLFQAKMNWDYDKLLVEQCIKMTTWREAAFVINYTPREFQAYTIDSVISSKGSKKKRKIETIPLADFLSNDFLNCHVGDINLKYNAKKRQLIWKALNGEIVAVNFTLGKRFRINIDAPNINKDRYQRIDQVISTDMIHKYRMYVSEEEMLLGSSSSVIDNIRKIRNRLALTYHPDHFNLENQFLKDLLNERMKEFNKSYEYVKTKRKSK